MLDEKLVRCGKCGQKISADAKFCPLCGAKVSAFQRPSKKKTVKDSAEPWKDGSRSSARERVYSSAAITGPGEDETAADTYTHSSYEEKRESGAVSDLTGGEKRKNKVLPLILILVSAAVLVGGVVFMFYLHFSNDISRIIGAGSGEFGVSSDDQYDYDFSDDMYDFSIFDLDMQAEIEEQVVYDHDKVKITLEALDLSSPSSYHDLKLLIENSGSETVEICQDYMTINGYTVSGFMSATVTAGSRSVQTVTIFSEDLIDAGMTDVAEIGLNFYTLDNDTYETTYRAEQVNVHTSMYGENVFEDKTEGQLMYEDDNVRLELRSVENNMFGDHIVEFYAENKTDAAIMLTSEDISVNDYMIHNSLYIYLLPDTKAVSDLYIYSDGEDEELTENIKKLSLSVHIYDDDSGRTLADTERIDVKVK